MYIKGFNKDLQCRGFQFEIGKTYDTGYTTGLKCCTETVFHFCDSLQNVHEYYSVLNENNRFCEIEVLGDLVKEEDKLGSNKIRIVREIAGDELKLLKMQHNDNAGIFNTGNWNTGNFNTGDRNTGNFNTGDRNTGNWNTGNYNTGNRNTGNYNRGYCNIGDYNTGDRNTGNFNTGDWNTGNFNTGDWNTGYCNTGNWNTGYCNTGNWNTGNWNTGDQNTGDWNVVDFETGFFNTKQGTVRIFNKSSNLTHCEFREKYGSLFYSFKLTEWIEYTDEEKENSVIRQCIGGYLKKYTFYEASENWYKTLNVDDKKLLFSIPNFDCYIFEQITGLDVEEDFKKYGKGE